jgi:hypothetical protein
MFAPVSFIEMTRRGYVTELTKQAGMKKPAELAGFLGVAPRFNG